MAVTSIGQWNWSKTQRTRVHTGWFSSSTTTACSSGTMVSRSAPRIYSSNYALRIEGKLYPKALASRKPIRRGAWFVLPLRHDQQAKVPSMLSSITSEDFAQVLLTLSSLTEIHVIDRTGSGLSGRFVRKPLKANPCQGWDECEIGGTWPASPVRRWQRFFYETNAVPPGISREGRSVEEGDRSIIILARPLDDG